MVLAPIDPVRRKDLEQLLDSMNDGLGQVNARNPLIPFAEFDTLHFARLVILNDGTLNDVRACGGGPAPTYPLYLAFLGDIDGELGSSIGELLAVWAAPTVTLPTVQNMSNFGALFGRETIYLSLTRRIAPGVG